MASWPRRKIAVHEVIRNEFVRAVLNRTERHRILRPRSTFRAIRRVATGLLGIVGGEGGEAEGNAGGGQPFHMAIGA